MNSNLTPVYLDYAATTPVDQRVFDAMLPFFQENFGNPSSVHRWGQKAEAAVEDCRETIAEGLGCLTGEIVFTSCGSESDNLALRGAAFAARELRAANRILISPVEHPAVAKTAKFLQKHHGFVVDELPVDKYGQVDPDDVAARIRQDTALVSVIYANNEIGTINPINEIGKICRNQAIPFHTDAVQAAAYLPVDVNELSVDLLSIGAHKFYGPKGVGALYVRKGIPLIPNQSGGSQEFGLRAGTLNVPYIVGLSKAFQITQLELESRMKFVRPLREHLINSILDVIPKSMLTGHPTQRLPNHTSFAFRHVDGNMLLIKLDARGFAVSSGSACKTGNPEPSDVLLAIGLHPNWALGSLRITFGIHSTFDHINALLKVLPVLIQQERSR
jgi:cysteine desulfurase